MSFEPGSRIFDYEITGVLGAGGMGKVYKVRNVISDRIDAMKVLLPDLAHQPELADRFLREIKVLASLNHPNIAAFHTALTFENQLIMVMEFVDGVTLKDKLEEGPIALADGVRYLDQVLAALSYAHKQGVIHRDIKPANMMLTPQGNVKLMDFGIAKAATDQQLTRTGTTVGSLHYISPEQLTGSTLDARSDLYSLGVSMYEILTGKRPFEGKSDFSLMTAHLQEAPRPPSEMNSTLPPAFNGLILMALAKNPEERFQSADAFRAALSEAAKGIPAAALKTAPAAARQAAPVPSPPPMAQAIAQPGTQLGSQAGAPPVASSVAPAAHPQGHRGLYVLLGAVIAVVIIVAGAVELPQWFRARARTQTIAPVSATKAVPSAPAQSENPPASSAPAQAAAAPISPTGPTGQQPAAQPLSTAVTTTGGGSPESARPETAIRRKHARGVEKSEGAAALVPSVSSAPSSAAAPVATSDAPASTVTPSALPASSPSSTLVEDAVALQALQDRMDLLTGRANAVKSTIDDLQKQVGTTPGGSLRPDVLASESSMERYMDEADAALSAHNAASAKHAMDLAEREIRSLEKF